MKIGILGGTFDPIHWGHLLLAEQARETGMLDEVWFIPAGIPPHKQHLNITSTKHRVQMVQLAIQSNPFFTLSMIEITRPGLSYMIDTLQILREKHPFYQFFLLIGTDMVKDLQKWYKIKEILQISRVIALGRVGFSTEEVPAYVSQSVIWITDGINTNISSTLIRERVSRGWSIRYMVPKKVWQYIKEHHLYET
jgi:nicotinate-nucleotide adenylyltransferase